MDMRIVGGAALALGTGVAAGLIARPMLFDRQNVTPEEMERRRSGNPQADGYAAVIPPMAGLGGGGAAMFGAYTKLSSGGNLGLGLGLAALGGALLGATVGGLVGASQGKSAREATHGPTLMQQADTFFERYDVDKSGALEIATGAGRLPEYIDEHGTSVQRAVTAADVDGNKVVTKQEWVDLMRPFDENGNDKLSSSENFEFMSEHGTYG